MFKAIYVLPLKFLFLVAMLAFYLSVLCLGSALMHAGHPLCTLLAQCTAIGLVAIVFVADALMKVLITLQYKHSVIPKLQAALRKCGLEQAEIDLGMTAGATGRRSYAELDVVLDAARPVLDQAAGLKDAMWNRGFSTTDNSELAQLARAATQLTRQLCY
jgi:hypothetical protein